MHRPSRGGRGGDRPPLGPTALTRYGALPGVARRLGSPARGTAAVARLVRFVGFAAVDVDLEDAGAWRDGEALGAAPG